MDWIHCNKCSSQPKSSSPGYLLTSCGHIFCEKCENREKVDQCKTCKTPCSVVKLSANMKPDVRAYFEEPEETAKRVLQTIRFQKNHRFNLFKTYKKISEQYVAAKSHIRNLEAEMSSLKKKLEQYEMSNAGSSARMPEFHLNLDASRKNSPRFNGICIQNSAQREKTNSSFRLPNKHAYQQYRNVVRQTPNVSPAESTPRNYSADIYQRKNVSFPQDRSKFPVRTPPNNDFQRMRITLKKY